MAWFSGKSSLILALLNFLDHSGTILIDGRDIKSVPHHILRSRITVISQKGVELSGSVRMNLDPESITSSTHRLSDDKLTAALQKVGLWGPMQSAGANLDTELNALSLSSGQKQLLCLARALLARRSKSLKLVLIDEATSNVDLDTEQRLQDVMKEEFQDCTVLMVTHRVSATEHFDTILQMGDDKILRTVRRDSETREWIDA